MSSKSQTANIPPVGNQVQGNNLSNATNYIFSKETFTLLMWALAIYVIIWFGSRIFVKREVINESSDQVVYGQSIDMVVFGLLILGLIAGYNSLKPEDKSNLLGWFIKWCRDFFDNPNTLIESGIFALVFFAMVYLFRVPMTPEAKPVTVFIIETKIWVVFASLFVVMFFKYVLGIPIIGILFDNKFVQGLENLPTNKSPGSSSPGGFFSKLFNRTTPSPATTSRPSTTTVGPSTTTTVGPSTPAGSIGTPSTPPGKNYEEKKGDLPSASPGSPSASPGSSDVNEVFNISENIYSYEDAKNVCGAYGARLANYDEVEEAYKKGGEWCNYGWSEGQMALFPTQKDTWNKLQKTKNSKNDCGRPGINGGYMENSKLMFGVNCFGKKRPPSDLEKRLFDYKKDNIIPSNDNDSNISSKSNTFKKQIEEGKINLNSYNLKTWSEY